MKLNSKCFKKWHTIIKKPAFRRWLRPPLFMFSHMEDEESNIYCSFWTWIWGGSICRFFLTRATSLQFLFLHLYRSCVDWDKNSNKQKTTFSNLDIFMKSQKFWHQISPIIMEDEGSHIYCSFWTWIWGRSVWGVFWTRATSLQFLWNNSKILEMIHFQHL